MTDLINNLTTEIVKKKFKNQFDLVNYAMKLAENMIKTGRAPRVKRDIGNTAMLVLQEIVEGVDQLDSLPEEMPAQPNGTTRGRDRDREPRSERVFSDAPSRKKGRAESSTL